MEIEISCDVVARLQRVNYSVPRDEPRQWLRSVFIERHAGHAFAGATNSRFAAIQYLGASAGDDGFTVLRHQGLISADPETKMKVSDFPAFGFCTVTGLDVTSGEDQAFRDVDAIQTLRDWRKWFPETASPAQPGRAMFIDLDGLTGLITSSPSGRVTFPKVIDADRPIVIRDVTDPNWIGVFFARPDTGRFAQGAALPDWIV